MCVTVGVCVCNCVCHCVSVCYCVFLRVGRVYVNRRGACIGATALMAFRCAARTTEPWRASVCVRVCVIFSDVTLYHFRLISPFLTEVERRGEQKEQKRHRKSQWLGTTLWQSFRCLMSGHFNDAQQKERHWAYKVFVSDRRQTAEGAHFGGIQFLQHLKALFTWPSETDEHLSH